MLRIFYTLLLYLVQPVLLLIALWRSLKSPNYRKRLNERYAFYFSDKPRPKGILIHAVSVGEVIAATPLVKRLQQQYPDLAITFTTITPTGSERVKAAFGDTVHHIYLPHDLPDAMARFVKFVQPQICIVIETEIWPNLIIQLKKRNIPFIIANGRLSERSARRYGLVKQALKGIFRHIDMIAAQDNVSLQRYLSLGFPSESLKLTGNIKYDLVINKELQQKIEQLKQQWQLDRPVWIAASTHLGEDEFILAAHKKLLASHSDLLLILVPRHPERFDSVAQLIEQQGLNYIRRSSQHSPQANTQVLLGDSMGELMLLYAMSNIAFVGGSLVKHGGHNPLEPLAFQLPVLSGQYTFNFPEVFNQLKQVNGVVMLESSVEDIQQEVEKLLCSPQRCQQFGKAGYQVLMENRGALQRLLDLLTPYLTK